LEPVDPTGQLVATGPHATHRTACHNPPTAEEAAAGRPLRGDHVPAPPPGGPSADVLDELAEAEAEAALIDETLRQTGPISVAPSAGGLPIPPEDGTEGRR
jgi:hypothetical protein